MQMTCGTGYCGDVAAAASSTESDQDPLVAALTDGEAGTRRGAARTSTGRAPRGQNRRLILEAIKDQPKTAGDVAKETGIGRPTVSTTLTKLVSDGAAVKAKRGYKAA